MSNEYTSDKTVIAAAQNFCISEKRAGREPVFTVLAVGSLTNFRQRRLFESAMTEYLSRSVASVHVLAAANVARFRAENYHAT